MPQTILLVDHALTRTFYKGALATIVVDGDAEPGDLPGGRRAGAGATPAPPPADAAQVTITKDGWVDPTNAANAFDPNTITIKVGATVTWTNRDTMLHTVTSGTSAGLAGTPDDRFDSGFLAAGATWSYTFTEAGEFPYFCTPHPWMQGKVIVTP